MGTGHVALPGGLEVVVESRASNNLIIIPDTPGHQPSSPSYDASNVNPWTIYALTAPSISAPSVKGLLLDTLNAPAPCTPVQSVESLVMWAPVVTILFPYRSILLIVHSRRLLTWRGSVHFLNTTCYSSFSSSFRLDILSYSMPTYLER